MKWFEIKAQADQPAEIAIYGEIGCWDMPVSLFIEQVKAMGAVQQINLSINSPGGSIFDAITMFNYLRRTGAEIVVRIDGLAASAASLLAMAGDKIIMPKNAMMMIHNPWSFAMGNADELREQADILDRVGKALVSTYTGRTGLPEETISELLATDTWMTADEALEKGFATEVIDTAVMQAKFDVSALPEKAKAVFASISQERTPTDDEVLELLGDGTEPEPQAPETPLTDLDDDEDIEAIIEEAVSNSMEYAASVADLCALAGMPAKAAGFIKAKTSLTDVKASLLTAKANAQPALNTTQQPEKSWKSLSLTEKSRLLREDPALAKQLQSME